MLSDLPSLFKLFISSLKHYGTKYILPLHVQVQVYYKCKSSMGRGCILYITQTGSCLEM